MLQSESGVARRFFYLPDGTPPIEEQRMDGSTLATRDGALIGTPGALSGIHAVRAVR